MGLKVTVRKNLPPRNLLYPQATFDVDRFGGCK
jgi:hypothetical protein